MNGQSIRIERSKAHSAGPAGGHHLPPPYVLVAEPSADVAHSLHSMIVAGGVACDVQDSGSNAITAFTVKDYDLILLSATLPDMHGADVAEAIRDSERHFPEPRTSIVVITRDPIGEELRRCKEAGADDYVARPFDQARWINAMRLIRPNRRPPSLLTREPIDFPKLLRRCIGERALAEDSIAHFRSLSGSFLAELKMAMQNLDVESVKTLATRIEAGSEAVAAGRIHRAAYLIARLHSESDLKDLGVSLMHELEVGIRDLALWHELHLGLCVPTEPPPELKLGKPGTELHRIEGIANLGIDIFAKQKTAAGGAAAATRTAS